MWSADKVRIIDIAQELGVSTATVSNVIHGKTKKISAQTVKRVQAKLEERGYIPNMAATLLAQNNSRIIGVVIKNHPKYEGRLLTDPFISSALNDLSDEIEKSGWFMMVKKAADIMEAVAFASMWNMDGMVLLSFCADEYQRLRDHIRIPFVVYDGYFENGERICNLRIDDRDGGRQVGRYFRELGHEKVLYIADNRECMDLERYMGLQEGLGQSADLLVIPMLEADRARFYRERLSRLRRYSAVFAASDYYAADLMQFLHSAGVRVPEDISVAGFDDSGICRRLSPPLTSVRQDGELRAVTAIRLLKRMKAEPTLAETVTLPVELIRRESTGRFCH